MASGRLRKLPVDYATGIARALQTKVFLKPMNPLVVRKKLRKAGTGPNFRPCQRTASVLKRGGDFLSKIIIRHHASARAVPIRAVTLWAHARVGLLAIAWNPLVTAPLAPVAHDRNRNARHVSMIGARQIFCNQLLQTDIYQVYD
jgi:hypothetical protein